MAIFWSVIITRRTVITQIIFWSTFFTLYDKDVGVIDDYCYLLADTVWDGNFEHIPVSAELEEAMKPGTYICVLFTSVWERR